jgi:DNA polymerase-4
MRKIIHIDMDAFYASVEQLDNPKLRGKPVIVGGHPNSRGVVSTCSYEARKYGVHSAMSSSKAYRLCPHAVFVHGHYDRYIEISKKVRAIMADYTSLIEPLSLDEAYLDVTDYLPKGSSATAIAEEIRNRIAQELHLTASAGVSYNMFLAKTASDIKKPNGLTVIHPKYAKEFIENLPVERFYGVGKATAKKMYELNIKRGMDLKTAGLNFLIEHFGKAGIFYYDLACGLDHRKVEPYHIRKSYGKERTFGEDIYDIRVICQIIKKLSYSVSEMLNEDNTAGKTITLKIKYDDFVSITRSKTLPEYVNSHEIISNCCSELLSKTEAGKRKVRLVGVSVSGLKNERDEKVEDKQLTFTFSV